MADFPRKGIDSVECIYVLASVLPEGGFGIPVKIGISRDPVNRVKTISTSCPFDVQIFFALVVAEGLASRVETAVHNSLKDYRTRGEWFGCSPINAAGSIMACFAAFLRFNGSSDDDVLEYMREAAWGAEEEIYFHFEGYINHGSSS